MKASEEEKKRKDESVEAEKVVEDEIESEVEDDKDVNKEKEEHENGVKDEDEKDEDTEEEDADDEEEEDDDSSKDSAEEKSDDETDNEDENGDDGCCSEYMKDSSHYCGAECCHQLVPDVPAEPPENDCGFCGRLMSPEEEILACKFCGADKCSECISKENEKTDKKYL